MSHRSLVSWRTDARKSLREVAGDLGIGGANPGRTLQRYETGARACPLDLAIRIQEYTGGSVTPSDFAAVRAEFIRHGEGPSPSREEDGASATSCPVPSSAVAAPGAVQ